SPASPPAPAGRAQGRRLPPPAARGRPAPARPPASGAALPATATRARPRPVPPPPTRLAALPPGGAGFPAQSPLAQFPPRSPAPAQRRAAVSKRRDQNPAPRRHTRRTGRRSASPARAGRPLAFFLSFALASALHPAGRARALSLLRSPS